MARLGIVFGLILCALTFAGLVASTEKSPTQFFPMMLGIPVLFCGVVALNPHRRRASMHAAASLALLGSLAGGGRVVFCLLQIARGGEVNRHGLNLLIAMTLVCTLFAVICVISFALMRRRRVQAASVARVGSIGLHQPQPGDDSVSKAQSRESA